MSRNSVTSRVLKVMSIFTGVESVGILCSIIKNKLVALWLSAVGIGLFTIFNQVIDTTSYLTSLGLRQSSVRDIARSRADESLLQRMIATVRLWSVLAGLAGALLLTALSRPLAEVILGDAGQWWNFVILGGVMLFNALYAGENSIFQGTENYTRLARTGLETALVGLAVSVPMYRWLGDESVVYSILAYAVIGCVFAWLNRNRSFPYRLAAVGELRQGTGFVKLGACMSVAAFVNTLMQLIFVSWLNVRVSTAEAGLYGAGITLVVRYTGLIFNSVGMEFYPRISANSESGRRVEAFVSHEVTLLLLIFTPLVLLLFMFLPLVIRLLYTEEFMVMESMVAIGMLSVLFRCVSMVMSYTMVAKGKGVMYMVIESVDAAVGLVLCIVLYRIWGLAGIGAALVLWHLLYMVVQCIVYGDVFRLRLAKNVIYLLLSSVVICGLALVARTLLHAVVWIPLLMLPALWYILLFVRMLRRRGVIGRKAGKRG